MPAPEIKSYAIDIKNFGVLWLGHEDKDIGMTVLERQASQVMGAATSIDGVEIDHSNDVMEAPKATTFASSVCWFAPKTLNMT
jgi:hypothetical protein